MKKLTGFIRELGKLGAGTIIESRDRKAAVSVISSACEQNIRVFAQMEGSSFQHDSTFIMIDHRKNLFFVDPFLAMGSGLTLVEGKSGLYFHFELKGARHGFDSIYRGKDNLDRFEVLKFDIPDKINAIHRRKDYRVKPKITAPVTVALLTEKKISKVGRASDISAGGLSFNSVKSLDSGLVIPALMKVPLEDLEFDVSLSIVGSDTLGLENSPRRDFSYRIRAQFTELGIGDTQRIREYVAFRQREINKLLG